MASSRIFVIAFLASCLLAGSINALDPLYRSASHAWSPHYRYAGSQRMTRRSLGSWTSGSSSTLANPVSMHSRSRASSSLSRRRHQDYSSKIIDEDDFRSDRRARVWNPNMKRRKPGRYSWTSRLIGANIACFALQTFFPVVTAMFLKRSDKILAGQQLYRLVTPIFLHGGIAHLAMNMYSLNNIGPAVEQLFGVGRYLSTYVLAGVAGNLVSAVQSPNPGLGASGAVFGIIGAQLVFLSRNDWLLGQRGEAMQSSILQTVVLNLVIGGMNPVIDNWAHLGGLVGGGVAAYYFGPRLYTLDVPATGSRFIVDVPVVRLPKKIESLPDKIAKRFQRITRRMQVNSHTNDLPSKPWRNSPPSQQQQKRDAPNRSIKPKL